MIYGATKQEWENFIQLDKNSLVPIVCNPTLPISPKSKLSQASIGKIPSEKTQNGRVYGLLGWQDRELAKVNLNRWVVDEDYGIGMVGYTYKAIDIDIDNEKISKEVEELIYQYLGVDCMFARRREGVGRCLLLFKLVGDIGSKQVIKTSAGAIEFLFSKCCYVVAGQHKSGKRYEWHPYMPIEEGIIELDVETLRGLITFLKNKYKDDTLMIGYGEPSLEVDERSKDQIDEDGLEYQAVIKSEYYNGYIFDDGTVGITCPWGHASSGGEIDPNPKATVYYPKGVGGLKYSGFKCQHTSHGNKTIGDFLKLIYKTTPYAGATQDVEEDGALKEISLDEFDPDRMRNGKIKGNMVNISDALRCPEFSGLYFRYDEFKDKQQVSRDKILWKDITDEEVAKIAYYLVKERDFEGASIKEIEVALKALQDGHKYDSLRDWLNGLVWDGVERIKDFDINVWGIQTPYTTAVSEYLWTSLAGRSLGEREIKADMVVALFGRQGTGKSTFTASLHPDPDTSSPVSFSNNFDDIIRVSIGKNVLEFAEMAGFTQRRENQIKSFISLTKDIWIPKFSNKSKTRIRRFILFATSNRRDVLTDPTGNRRWLPIDIGDNMIDIDWLVRNREQLWAEGVLKFRSGGVAYKNAYELAKPELIKYQKADAWEGLIKDTIARNAERENKSEFEYEVRILDLAEAVNRQVSDISWNEQFRLLNIMTRLGYTYDNVRDVYVKNKEF